MNPRIELICVGTELLTGQVNTHTAFLGRKLLDLGLSLACDHSVPDDAKLMKEVFERSLHSADIVFCAGGLGPTFDDITRDVWARVVKRPLRLNSSLVREIKAKFTSRGLVMPPMNRRQGQVLKGADIIPNALGTAPGQFLRLGKKILILLPGPARELVPMVEDVVLPRLKSLFLNAVATEKKFHMIGVPESRVDQLIRPLVKRYARVGACRVTHGILASHSIITVKYRVDGSSPKAVEEALHFLDTQFRPLLQEWIFGEDGDSLEAVVARRLIEQQKKLAVAESCTGGGIAKLLTDLPGSSAFFVEGVVTYANESKRKRLGVSKAALDQHGAVSEIVARQMAEGLKRSAHVDFTLSVTGIAGPAGGTPEKPVGLVYIGCSGPQRTVVRRFHFVGNRAWIRERSTLMALDILRKELDR